MPYFGILGSKLISLCKDNYCKMCSDQDFISILKELRQEISTCRNLFNAMHTKTSSNHFRDQSIYIVDSCLEPHLVRYKSLVF